MKVEAIDSSTESKLDGKDLILFNDGFGCDKKVISAIEEREVVTKESKLDVAAPKDTREEEDESDGQGEMPEPIATWKEHPVVEGIESKRRAAEDQRILLMAEQIKQKAEETRRLLQELTVEEEQTATEEGMLPASDIVNVGLTEEVEERVSDSNEKVVKEEKKQDPKLEKGGKVITVEIMEDQKEMKEEPSAADTIQNRLYSLSEAICNGEYVNILLSKCADTDIEEPLEEVVANDSLTFSTKDPAEGNPENEEAVEESADTEQSHCLDIGTLKTQCVESTYSGIDSLRKSAQERKENAVNYTYNGIDSLRKSAQERTENAVNYTYNGIDSLRKSAQERKDTAVNNTYNGIDSLCTSAQERTETAINSTKEHSQATLVKISATASEAISCNKGEEAESPDGANASHVLESSDAPKEAEEEEEEATSPTKEEESEETAKAQATEKMDSIEGEDTADEVAEESADTEQSHCLDIGTLKTQCVESTYSGIDSLRKSAQERTENAVNYTYNGIDSLRKSAQERTENAVNYTYNGIDSLCTSAQERKDTVVNNTYNGIDSLCTSAQERKDTVVNNTYNGIDSLCKSAQERKDTAVNNTYNGIDSLCKSAQERTETAINSTKEHSQATLVKISATASEAISCNKGEEAESPDGANASHVLESSDAPKEAEEEEEEATSPTKEEESEETAKAQATEKMDSIEGEDTADEVAEESADTEQSHCLDIGTLKTQCVESTYSGIDSLRKSAQERTENAVNYTYNGIDSLRKSAQERTENAVNYTYNGIDSLCTSAQERKDTVVNNTYNGIDSLCTSAQERKDTVVNNTYNGIDSLCKSAQERKDTAVNNTYNGIDSLCKSAQERTETAINSTKEHSQATLVKISATASEAISCNKGEEAESPDGANASHVLESSDAPKEAEEEEEEATSPTKEEESEETAKAQAKEEGQVEKSAGYQSPDSRNGANCE